MSEKAALEDDIVTRYLYSSSDFNSNGVKYQAFIDTRNPSELSVCIITNLLTTEIWNISSVIRQDKPVKARADLTVLNINDAAFKNKIAVEVMIDGIPHPNHANIKFPILHKSIIRAVAADLANRSTLEFPLEEIEG